MAIPIFKKKKFISPKMAAILNFQIFRKNCKKQKYLYLKNTVLDRAISTKFLTHRVSLQSGHPNFQKKFLSPKMEAISEFFAKNARHKNAYISKTVLDRADYADLGYYNSIRLKAEHFLNTVPLTFICFGTLCNIIFFFPSASKEPIKIRVTMF